MFRHVIAPNRRFTKASHDVVRHPRLNNDAKILLLYIQGLPAAELGKPLSTLALRVGIKGAAYQRVKQLLIVCGYFFEWSHQGERGRWVTRQLLANVTLTADEAARCRDGDAAAPPPPSTPSATNPAAGEPEDRVVGDSPPLEEQLQKENDPHPPPQERENRVEPAGADDPEVVAVEGMLLSLRHTHRDLYLGVREARRLAQDAVQWLRCGVPVGELRRRLTEELPKDGVRCAVGFLRYRLAEKAPGPPAFGPPPALSASEAAALTRERSALVTCEGPGAEHVFRPVNAETCCAPCRQEAAWQQSAPPPHAAADVSWRERVEAAAARG